MAYNRELSQFSSFVEIDDSSKNISIAPNAAQNVGLGLTNPTSKLQVTGDVNISGATTTVRFTATNATASYLSGISLNYSGISTFSSLVVSGISTFNDKVDVFSNVNISGIVTAPTFVGNLTGTATTASTVNVLNTNGLTTVYYPTFVEDRTDGQIVRADVDITYRTDDNTLTVPNINLSSSGLTVGTGGTVITTTSGGSVGIGTTNPTSKLSVVGDVNITGVITAPTFDGNATTASYAPLSGIATYATNAGIATYADTAGIATYASNAGIATYADTAGISTTSQGLTGTPSINVQNITVAGVATISGNLNATNDYYVKLARLTNQTIPNGVDTPIAFTATSDTNGWYSGITTRTTPMVAGLYRIDGMVNWVAGSITNNQSNIQLRKNGTTFAVSQVGIQTFSYTQNVSGIVTMNGTTDYIDFTAYTSNPTSQDLTGTADGSWTKMEIVKIN